MVSKTYLVKVKRKVKNYKRGYRKGQDPTVFTDLNKISTECSNLTVNSKNGQYSKEKLCS